jgi:hypothetical protein
MMTQTKRALALLAVVALALSLPACKKLNDDERDEDPFPTSEELSIVISQTFFEFTHVVGQSPCPQLVGRLTIRNMGTSPFTTDVRPRGTVPLAFSATNVTVQPGGSVTIDIFFTCASQNSFIVTVDTLRENQQQQSSDSLPPGSFNVSGLIRR